MKARVLPALVMTCSFFASQQGVHAASHGAPAHHTSHPRVVFDVNLYERYQRAHHLAPIPYLDRSGALTPFARAWMQHRKLCGGAVTGIMTNPTTLSSIQQWQGCSATRKIGQTAILFQKQAWMS